MLHLSPSLIEIYTNRAPNMFSMIDSKPHSIRKRMLANIYSKSFVQSSSELHKISQLIIFGRLLPLLDKVATNNQPLDVFEINCSSAIDFILAFVFGLQNGTNFLQDMAARRHWLEVYQSRYSCEPIFLIFS